MERKNTAVAYVLLTGVIVSFLLLAIGLTEAVLSGGPALVGVHGLRAIVHGLLRGDATSTIDAGLLVLMATPVLRVGVLVVEFIRSRETPFALISIVVLFLLAASVTIGVG
ncbi:MAG: DUF1634 domain-containing protein [Acidobacteriota bacterium]